MPNYTSAAEFENVANEDLLGQLSNDAGPSDVPDTTVIDYALDRAEALAESYAASRYTVPFDSSDVTEAFKDAVYVIALCRLYLRRPGMMPDELKEAHTEAIAYLEKVQSGQVTPVTVSPAAGSCSGADDELFDDIQVF